MHAVRASIPIGAHFSRRIFCHAPIGLQIMQYKLVNLSMRMHDPQTRNPQLQFPAIGLWNSMLCIDDRKNRVRNTIVIE